MITVLFAAVTLVPLLLAVAELTAIVLNDRFIVPALAAEVWAGLAVIACAGTCFWLGSQSSSKKCCGLLNPGGALERLRSRFAAMAAAGVTFSLSFGCIALAASSAMNSMALAVLAELMPVLMFLGLILGELAGPHPFASRG